MSDYISREAAIEAMYKDAETHPSHTFWTSQNEALRNIPAADVRPVRRGKWKVYNNTYACSACGRPVSFWQSNFCPNCGTDMREES